MTEAVPIDHDPFAAAETVQGASPWPAPENTPERHSWQRDPAKGFWENEWDRYKSAAGSLGRAFAGAGEEGLRAHPVSALPMAAYDTYRGLKEFAETPESERPSGEEHPSAWQSAKNAFGSPLPLVGIAGSPKSPTGKYAFSPGELPYALVWGQEGGLAAHGVVKSSKYLPKIEEMTKEGTPKEQQQARMRVDYMAQKAGDLQREWQHSRQEPHRAEIDNLAQATTGLQQAYHAGDWDAFRELAGRTQEAIDRFAGYTGKHFDAMEAKRNAGPESGHAAGGAVRPAGFPHARYIGGKWLVPDHQNPGDLTEISA